MDDGDGEGLKDDGDDMLEPEDDEGVPEEEADVGVLDVGVPELALELLRGKKDDDVVDGLEVPDAVIIEAPVGVSHIVVFDIE